MPFGKWDNFAHCVRDNQDKENPEAFCADIHKKITGKWPREFLMEMINNLEKKLCKEGVININVVSDLKGNYPKGDELAKIKSMIEEYMKGHGYIVEVNMVE